MEKREARLAFRSFTCALRKSLRSRRPVSGLDQRWGGHTPVAEEGWARKLGCPSRNIASSRFDEDSAAHLQQEMSTFRRPAHWLMVAHPLIDQMAHCGFGWSARDPQPLAPVTSDRRGFEPRRSRAAAAFGHLFSMRITPRAFAASRSSGLSASALRSSSAPRSIWPSRQRVSPRSRCSVLSIQ